MKILAVMLLVAGATLSAGGGNPSAAPAPQGILEKEIRQGKSEIVSIQVQVRMPDRSYKSLLLMGKDLTKHNAIFWNGGAEQMLLPFYRQVRGEHHKADSLQKKLTEFSPTSGSLPAITIKWPECETSTWPSDNTDLGLSGETVTAVGENLPAAPVTQDNFEKGVQRGKTEIVSIQVQARMPDGSYKSLLFMGKDLTEHNAIFWNGGAEQVLLPFYRQVRGEHDKADFLQKKLTEFSPTSGAIPVLTIKRPSCSSGDWP
ncbi:MAG: hypothetical protein Q8O00_00610 [Holophaga sp.]|nr:hypothetical protein [Holophaga sp.]